MRSIFSSVSRICSALAIAALTVGCIPESNETIEVPQPNSDSSLTNPRPGASAPRGSAATGDDEPRTQSQPVAPSTAQSPAQSNPASFNRRFALWFSSKNNYDLVFRDVLGFYADGRYNGCVAFLSSALRRMDVNIPIHTNSSESPSLVTRPFSNYLEDSLGWQRIESAEALQSGDIVFTQDSPSFPGYPAHTYMFFGWSKKSAGIALVIDNQEFTHERNIYSHSGGFNFTPYAYALRAP